MTERDGPVPDPVQALSPRPAFATRAHGRMLEGLGWQRTATPRHDAESHAPLQCCFILRDGRREEAAFGYTAVTAPDAAHCPTLGKAKSHVERFLTRLGEDSGILFQNTPLVAFGGRRRDRVAVFGGWRFRRGRWTPFLLGPDGLAGVADHDVLFARGTAPADMAEMCGHETVRVMPRIAELVRAIETPGQGGTAERDVGDLQFAPHASGWFMARTGTPDVRNVSLFGHTNAPFFRQTGDAAPNNDAFNDALQVFEGDEFRFRKFGMDRT